MAVRDRGKHKGRGRSPPFTSILRSVLDHPDYIALPYHAKVLLLEAAHQFRGNNNGDICLAFSMMKLRGWSSADTLSKARNALVESGFLILSRQGGRNRCSLYALSWKAIDDCKGKLDIQATTTPPRKFSLENIQR